ncbi:hypothetical protein ScPMuIL_008894 [Solemya velum]
MPRFWRRVLNVFRRDPAVAPEPTAPTPLSPFDKDPRAYATTGFIQNLQNEVHGMKLNMLEYAEKIDMMTQKLAKFGKEERRDVAILWKKIKFLGRRVVEFEDDAYPQSFQIDCLLKDQKEWEYRQRHRIIQTDMRVPLPCGLDLKYRALDEERTLAEFRETEATIKRLVIHLRISISDLKKGKANPVAPKADPVVPKADPVAPNDTASRTSLFAKARQFIKNHF